MKKITSRMLISLLLQTVQQMRRAAAAGFVCGTIFALIGCAPRPAMPRSSGELKKKQVDKPGFAGQNDQMRISEWISKLATSDDKTAVAQLEAMFADAVFGLLMSGLPKEARPGQKLLVDGSRSVTMQFVSGPNGEKMIKACADPALFNVNYPGCINVTMSGQELIEMAEKLPDADGILICSATSFHSFPIFKADYARVKRARPVSSPTAHTSFGKSNDMVTIPPGHKVVMVHPTPTAHFGRVESGAWVADLGAGTSFSEVVSRVAQMASEGQEATVIWILQRSVLESGTTFDLLLKSLATIVQRSRGTLQHCAVVPHATERHHPQMRQLRESGLAVHHSADDGACFVEVHRPDGIVVGMPGKAFTE